MSASRVAPIVLGLAWFAGALALLYFSSSPALHCTRIDGRVDCVVTAKALNRVVVKDARVSGVRSVVLVNGRPKAILYFRTDTGDVDLGYFSQRFTANVTELDAFVRESTEAEMRLDTGVTFQNMAAYAGVAFLLLGGLAALSSSRGKRRRRSVYDPPDN